MKNRINKNLIIRKIRSKKTKYKQKRSLIKMQKEK